VSGMILNCLVSWHGNDLQHIIKGYSFMASAGFAQIVPKNADILCSI
jgi:hypothetical protein